MKYYMNRLQQLENEKPVLSSCGDDCAVCPRHIAATEEELHETALFWQKAGWRDHVMTAEETRCAGCGSRGTCSFGLIFCQRERGITSCRECPENPCDKIRDTFARSDIKKAQCEKACENEAEFRMLCRAFYEKEKNLGCK